MSRDNGKPAIGTAYAAGDEIVILGTPPDFDDSVSENDPRRHNCDAMGCGYEHVLYRFRKPQLPEVEVEVEEEPLAPHDVGWPDIEEAQG